MMKIAYLLKLNIDRYPGIYQKVKNQATQWLELGHDVHVFCICPGSDQFRELDNWTFYYEGGKANLAVLNTLDFIGWSTTYNEVSNDIISFAPKVIYLRNTFYQPFIHRLIKRIPSVIEVNTFEKPEYILLAKTNLKYKVVLPYFLLTNRIFLKASKGVCVVTHGLKHYLMNEVPGIECKVIPNSIRIDSNDFENHATNGLPQLVFIGTPNQPWNGIDLLLKIAKATVGKLEFHIIGFDTEPDAPSNVRFYGELTKNEFSKVFQQIDIGIGTLALFRKKMDEASPLKVREYLSFGIPIVINYTDTAFVNDSPDWVLKFPGNETDIVYEVDKIVAFAERYKGHRLTFDEVSPYVNSAVLEVERLNFIEDQIR